MPWQELDCPMEKCHDSPAFEQLSISKSWEEANLMLDDFAHQLGEATPQPINYSI